MSLIPGLGRSPGGGNGNPSLYSCRGNPIDGVAWQAAVLEVTKSWTQLSTSNLVMVLTDDLFWTSHMAQG